MDDKVKVHKSRIFRAAIILGFIITLLIMRQYEPLFKAYSNGTSTLDMRFHYTSNETYQLLGELGIQGRLLYSRILMIDFIFITCFALVQNFILKSIIGKDLIKTGLRYLLLISYLRGLSDIIENISILIMINKYPLQIQGLIPLSSFFTTLKFIFLGMWLIAIPISLFVRIKNRKG